MRVGAGVSKLKEAEGALQEAYRKSLQRLGATKADLCFIFYSYDYALDAVSVSSAFKKVLRDIPHFGASSWSAWTARESFEGETGMLVVSLKAPAFEFDFFKVHSLREKAELWSAEISRQIGDRLPTTPDFLFLIADSLNFVAGNGFAFVERQFPQLPICGMGTSFSVPQCSLACNGEVHMNSLLGMTFKGIEPWVGIYQNIKPELEPIAVNRMSENLVIEIDQKPAFYKLCEHLMTHDDLPMMSPDEFRRHMGNLYIIEKGKTISERPRTIGDNYRVIPLLGSEMTTGMVAVANSLDFSQVHYLGQKKATYAERDAEQILQQIREKVPNPSMVWMLSSTSRFRDTERKLSDLAIVESIFPDVPIMGMATNGEYLGGLNQSAGIVIAFP